MSTGIPGVEEYTGNQIAAALGLFSSEPQIKKLEILNELSKNTIDNAKDVVDRVKLKVVDKNNLYIHVILEGDNRVESLIENEHTNLKWVKINGNRIWESQKEKKGSSLGEGTNLANKLRNLSINDMVRLVEEEFSEKHMEFLKKGLQRNMRLVRASEEDEASGVGKHCTVIAGDDKVRKIGALIAQGVDARMSGAPYPAMASSGSGNQGITISIGIYEVGQLYNHDEYKIFKATMLGHVVSFYTKLFTGRLSALCGLFSAAAPGLLAGFLYMDNLADKIEHGINTLYGNVSGVLCDGAKNTCALKAYSGFELAYNHYQLIKDGLELKLPTGYICNNLDDTLHNISKLSKPTDNTVNDTLVSVIESSLNGHK